MKVGIHTDSNTFFNVSTRNGRTTKKRLLIDMQATREAYNEGIVGDLI